MKQVETSSGIGGLLAAFRKLARGRKKIRKELASTVVMTEYGMQLGEKADPASDTVVLLGGLAMPKLELQFHAFPPCTYWLGYLFHFWRCL